MLRGHHKCGKLFKGMHKWCLESWKGQIRYHKQMTKCGKGEIPWANRLFFFHLNGLFSFHKDFSFMENSVFLKDFKVASWQTCRWRRKPPIEWGMPKPPLWQLPLPPGLGISLCWSSWYKADYKQQSSLLLLGPFSAVHRTRSPPELLL